MRRFGGRGVHGNTENKATSHARPAPTMLRNPSLLQNDPNAEPNAMTTASAKSAPTIATMTISR
jgi:hypothetical protein